MSEASGEHSIHIYTRCNSSAFQNILKSSEYIRREAYCISGQCSEQIATPAAAVETWEKADHGSASQH